MATIMASEKVVTKYDQKMQKRKEEERKEARQKIYYQMGVYKVLHDNT